MAVKDNKIKTDTILDKPNNGIRRIGVPLIDVIDCPEKLRKLDPLELPWLADDIRKRIIEVTSKNGGHIGPSLGVVELTIALHYVFNTPQDKLIWDVGHQCYAHKILTGRNQRFATIRQSGGLSGFTKRSESVYDPFGAGHSSTSISAGLGMAVARDLTGGNNNVIAVIGDGSLSAGLAFEAMNNAGDTPSKLIVILNDNEMSISEPVGALSSYMANLNAYFSKFITSERFLNIRDAAYGFASKFSSPIRNFARRTESYAKGLVSGATLFEELGFYYVGPIDGDDDDDLIPVLQNVRDSTQHQAFLIHVKTKKGHGYNPAEKFPTKFHGVSKFDIATGEFLSSSGKKDPSCTEGFSDMINRFAANDDKVVAITAAMPSGTGLDKFAKNYPKQFFDVGIAEQHAVTFAAGLAENSQVKPFVAVYSSFLQRAYDEVVHDVVLQSLPVRFMIDRAGFVGNDGVTHHGLYDISLMMNLHNIVVMAPASYADLLNMIRTAYEINDKPSLVRYPRGSLPYTEEINQEGSPLEIGKARIIRQGKKGVIFSLGSRLADSIAAADMIEKKFGFTPTIVDARFAKPFDKELFAKLAQENKYFLTVEEGAKGGFGAAVTDFLCEKGLLDKGLKIRNIAIDDKFYDHASQAEQISKAGLDANGIYRTFASMLKK
jgi:1-deoxy-D-xylulose-5-phosphate synthase